MVSEAQIESEIKNIVGRYSAWTIGITDNPDRRKTEHGNPSSWRQWKADSETVARNVEAYFIAKEMKGGPGGEGWQYVYIFIH